MNSAQGSDRTKAVPLEVMFDPLVPEATRQSALDWLTRAGMLGSTRHTPQVRLWLSTALPHPACARLHRHLLHDHRPLIATVLGPVAPDEIVRGLAHAGITLLYGHELAHLIQSLAATARRLHDIEDQLEEHTAQAALIGRSHIWRALLRELVWMARYSELPILLYGETGTGKEALAKLVHDVDPRPDKGDFVVIDCTTLNPDLAGSELFGHERGAFTGAHSARSGAAMQADGGTLFLDEVGELPLPVQAQLLRLLQEGSFKPVGGARWQRTRFRLVCATHRDLRAQVSAGHFREDLYYRLNGWLARVPPLRQRGDDMALLISHFLHHFGAPPRCDALVLAALQRHSFPGNVRELRQIIQQAAVRHCGDHPLSLADLPANWLSDHANHAAPAALPAEPLPPALPTTAACAAADTIIDSIAGWVRDGVGLREIVQRAGDTAISEALALEQHHVGRAARRLGVTERAIQLRRAQRLRMPPA